MMVMDTKGRQEGQLEQRHNRGTSMAHLEPTEAPLLSPDHGLMAAGTGAVRLVEIKPEPEDPHAGYSGPGIQAVFTSEGHRSKAPHWGHIKQQTVAVTRAWRLGALHRLPSPSEAEEGHACAPALCEPL